MFPLSPMPTLWLFLGIFLIAAGIVVAFFLQKKRTDETALSARLDAFVHLMTAQLTEMRRSVDDRLKESNQLIHQTHAQSAQVFGKVSSELTKVSEEMKRVHDVGKDISTLQEILKAPKLRGILGEFFLEDLLAQYFAKEQYAIQYAFKGGDTVDAVVYVRDRKMVPVDAKFPLENFKKILDVTAEGEREKAKRTFRQDVKRHIDDIAGKYILPDEGTLEFALMYIPAENVYYELIVRDRDRDESLASYALSRNVFPVSPNTFALYLTTILAGLRGMEIERRARQIMDVLAQIRVDFSKFEEEFDLLGKHLGHAKGSYETSAKRLEHLGEKLERVDASVPLKVK